MAESSYGSSANITNNTTKNKNGPPYPPPVPPPPPGEIVGILRSSLIGSEAAAVGAERLELREEVAAAAEEAAAVGAERLELRQDLVEVAEEVAAYATERTALKQELGDVVEEAAALAVERTAVKMEAVAVGAEAAAAMAERTTNKQTLFHLVKGNIGPGCLSLPWAFSQLGIPLASVCTVLLALWTYHNSVTLLKIKAKFTSNRRTVTYSDVGEIALGKYFRLLVTGSIILLQFAIGTVFLSFVGENMAAFFSEYLPGVPLLRSSPAFNTALILPIAGHLTMLRNLKSLGPVSEIATVFLFIGFACLAVTLSENYATRPPTGPSLDWLHLPMALCGILYSFEGICIVLPVESAMRERPVFLKTFTLVYIIVTIVYCTVGSVCVWILGSVQNGSITAFLLNNTGNFVGMGWVTLANLAVTVSVLLTYPLMMFPCIELWCQARERYQRGGSLEPSADEDDWWGGSMAYGPFDTPVMRSCMVLLTFLVAVAVPNVQQLIALAGALAGASTALIIPPLLQLRFVELEYEGTWSKTLQLAKCYILLTLGIVFCLIGSAAAVWDIVKLFLE